MPHAVENEYKFIKAKPLHPTFVAEVSNVDFSQPVSEDVFAEILSAITKVSGKASQVRCVSNCNVGYAYVCA